MSACDGHKEIGFARPTWSLPPHSPAGAFAPKDMASPLLTLSALLPAGLTSKPHHARRNFSGLRGSFCLRLASIFNHGRARTHPHYTRNSIRCQSRKGEKQAGRGWTAPAGCVALRLSLAHEHAHVRRGGVVAGVVRMISAAEPLRALLRDQLLRKAEVLRQFDQLRRLSTLGFCLSGMFASRV